MFRFGSPEYLKLLYALIPLVLLAGYHFYKKRKVLQQFADAGVLQSLIREKSLFKEGLNIFFFLSALSLGVIALARPQLGTRLEEVKQKGIDLFILLDVSNSMRAEDLKPNRLDKAKNEISRLIKKLSGDRIGLIVFAGEAYLQFPLTTDYSAAGLFLTAANENTVPVQGTALAAALNLAAGSFDKESPTKKAVILITDGEDHQGDLDGAVTACKEKGAKIYSIGMGSPTGAPIPMKDENGNTLGFKNGSDGQPILTKLDEATLTKVARDGEGKYILNDNNVDAINQIYDELAKLEKTEFGAKRITDYEDKFHYFLFPALILLMLSFLLPERKSKVYAQIFRRKH